MLVIITLIYIQNKFFQPIHYALSHTPSTEDFFYLEERTRPQEYILQIGLLKTGIQMLCFHLGGMQVTGYLAKEGYPASRGN